jgi:outer membrane protein assembly factor BamB
MSTSSHFPLGQPLKVAVSRGAALFTVLFLTATSFSADWPGWRGAKRDDVSVETGLLKSWPAKGPKQLWLFENAGKGYAGYSVVGGRLFTMGTRDAKELLIALDAATGKELWALSIGDIFNNKWGDGPRSTPTVDGANVYAMSAQGNLVCAQVSDGKMLWYKKMKDLGGSVPPWGYAESPLVDGNRVVVTPGGGQGTMAAFDKSTGEALWQSSEITEGAQYSSVVPAMIDGKPQYVQLVMQTVFGVNPADGKLLWRSPFPGRTAVIPTPIVKGNAVFVTAGYGVGCKKVEIVGNSVRDVFSNKEMENHHGGVVLVGDHLYGHSGRAGWTCMQFSDGTVKWTERRALGKGAVTYADGMLYCLDEKTGEVALVEASPSGWNEKGRLKLEPLSSNRSRDGGIWPHPVVANGRLFLRDQEYVYCFDVKQ